MMMNEFYVHIELINGSEVVSGKGWALSLDNWQKLTEIETEKFATRCRKLITLIKTRN